MVYIASDGSIHQGPLPWGVRRIKETFWSLVDALGLFVTTLIPVPIAIPRVANNRLQGSGSTGGSGNSQPGSGRRPGGGPSNRPVNRFRTMSDLPPPPMTSCCGGGGCGM